MHMMSTAMVAEGEDDEELQQLNWLHRMALFCQELQCFLGTVPADANLHDYAANGKVHAGLPETPMYSNLAEACDPARTQYMEVTRHRT